MNVSEQIASLLSVVAQYAARDLIERQQGREAAYTHLRDSLGKLGVTIDRDEDAGGWSLLVVAPIDFAAVAEYLNGTAGRTGNATCDALTSAAFMLSQGYFVMVPIGGGLEVIVGPRRPDRLLRIEQRHHMQRIAFAYVIDAGFGDPWAAVVRPAGDDDDRDALERTVALMNKTRVRRDLKRRKRNT